LNGKEVFVVGDRVLLEIDDSERRTEVGLYLPESVKDKDEVRGGTIVKSGQGIPLVEPSHLADALWNSSSKISLKYIPMEAQPGDYALFLRKAAIELEFKGKKYLIVPQSAILVLVRDEVEEDGDVV